MAEMNAGTLRQVVEKLKEQKMRLEQREKVLFQQQSKLDAKENALEMKERDLHQLAISFRDRQKDLISRQGQLRGLEQTFSQKLSENQKEGDPSLSQLMSSLKQLENEHLEIQKTHLNRIRELEKALGASRKEEIMIAQLEANIVVMEKRLSELSKERESMEQLREGNRNTKEMIAKLEEELSEYQKEASIAETQLEKAELERKRLLIEVEELAENNRYLNDELVATKREIEVHKKRTQGGDIDKQFDQIRKENDGLKREIELLNQQNLQLQDIHRTNEDRLIQEGGGETSLTSSALQQQEERVSGANSAEYGSGAEYGGEGDPSSSQENVMMNPQDNTPEQQQQGGGGEGFETDLSGGVQIDEGLALLIGKEFKLKWNYVSDDGSFEVQKNEIVTLVDPTDADWYQVRTLLTEEVGYVPSAYLKRIEKKAKEKKSEKELIAEVASSWKTNPEPPLSPSSSKNKASKIRTLRSKKK
eukprot:CAMPEP_0201488816 /NCGR_PEP_ID=MMETSP0151_2-20130828/19502_1 /ASSEMBLY_ACC=CAM_ASM_000257 /TAXON_ID=200890 /ORGANISM="Paramoeba atlantica, Strain 621/1 / CCAP 1560/9" /LENGTH=475 /DNA_ID=CAMNT_0047874177 /DNA_START=115 /DNA_END=1542 /DNA_ORIENTATION=-